MFEFEPYERDIHYQMLLDWWQRHGTPGVAPEYLPQGVVVKKGDDYLYGLFLYFTGTKLAWISWIVSNPDVPPTKKRGALQYGIDVLSYYAKMNGVTDLFTMTNNEGLINSLKKSNFIVGDTNSVNMFKKI